jgi:hypothetical protein
MRLFEKKVLGRVFGPKRKEIKGKQSKLNNERIYGLHSSPSIIRLIKSRRMR